MSDSRDIGCVTCKVHKGAISGGGYRMQNELEFLASQGRQLQAIAFAVQALDGAIETEQKRRTYGLYLEFEFVFDSSTLGRLCLEWWLVHGSHKLVAGTFWEIREAFGITGEDKYEP